jgi:hypothetical protein
MWWCIRFFLCLTLWPYVLAGIYFLVLGCSVAFFDLVIGPICEITHLDYRGESAAMQQIQMWDKKHPFVEPTPTPEVRRAVRVGRGIHGQIVPLPPTLPNGQFDLNSGM